MTLTSRGRLFAAGVAAGAALGLATLLPSDLLSEPRLPNLTDSPFPGMRYVVTPAYEDEPGWDCRTDGNRECGPAVIITGDCVTYPDWSITCRDADGDRWSWTG